MPYYQLAFNKPFAPFYIYEHAKQLPLLIRVEAPLASRRYTALLVKCAPEKEVQLLRERGVRIKSITRIVDTTPILTQEQYELAQWMSTYYLASLGECLFTMIPSARREKEHDISELVLSHFTKENIVLSDEQQSSIDTMLCAMRGSDAKLIDDENALKKKNAKNAHFYLHGATGSGKTEVFLQLAQKIIKHGGQVLYLVPEISLAYQAYPNMCERFGKENVAILHSALTGSQRLREWKRIMNEEAKIILGVRSAVFAPTKNLQLIIIDEEHDTAYKSDTTPRYHARQIALKRSFTTGAMVVMGSATPSLESWNYIQNKGFIPLRLHKRAGGGESPTIELVSLQNVSGIISPTLHKHMHKTLEQGFQVLLLINRRGFSRSFLCTSCGDVISCPHCSVQLVLHKTENTNTLE